MQFLATTDLEIASWKGQMLRTEYMAKVAEAMAFKALEGGVEERRQAARTIPEVQAKWEEHWDTVVKYENLRARRERAVLTVELWRSVNASRRQGQMQ